MIKERHIEVNAKNKVRNGMPYIEYSINSQTEKTDLLYISPIDQELSWHQQCQNNMHGHDFNLIIWFKNGKGIHYVDFEKYEVNSNMIFFLSPNNMHYYEALNCQEGYTIAFTNDFFEHIDYTIVNKMRHELFNNRKGANFCIVPNTITEQLQNYINKMLEETKHNSKCILTNSILSSLLTLFLITLRRECTWNIPFSEVDRNSHSYICYTSFLDAIQQYYHCQHSVKKYADMLGISFCLLSKYTKEHEQRTPFEILTERIIVEAKRNLKYSSLRIKEIASNLGFNDTSYFIRYFKRYVGISPIDFRNQQKNC